MVDHINLKRVIQRASTSHQECILRRNPPLTSFCENFPWQHFRLFQQNRPSADLSDGKAVAILIDGRIVGPTATAPCSTYVVCRKQHTKRAAFFHNRTSPSSIMRWVVNDLKAQGIKTMSESNIEGKQSAFDPAGITALSHLYRGELYRSTVWRTHLDATTNWAVLTTGIALSLTFSSESASPLPLVLVGLLVATFLCIEARRYRFFDFWRMRACPRNPILRANSPWRGRSGREWLERDSLSGLPSP
jgi:hypothetical protein